VNEGDPHFEFVRDRATGTWTPTIKPGLRQEMQDTLRNLVR
jgi:hypothetical protein